VKVTQIMSRPVITVAPGTGIKEAARLLVEHGISALPVLDATGKLVGIVSEADLLPTQTRPDPRSQATPLPPSAGSAPQTVREVMTRPVLVLTADAEVSQAAQMMLETNVKRLPIVEGGQVIGIVSRRDLVKVIARRDDELEGEVARRLGELGLDMSRGAVKVAGGVATIHIEEQETTRRLAESVALTVPGVLEVRFAAPRSASRVSAAKRAGGTRRKP
jgi:CBS domain-containing protein